MQTEKSETVDSLRQRPRESCNQKPHKNGLKDPEVVQQNTVETIHELIKSEEWTELKTGG